MEKHPQTGYSWLGISPDNHVEDEPLLSDWQRARLNNDCEAMDTLIYTLENKVFRYHHLCKKYEKTVGTKQGEGILHQMENLQGEIDGLSKRLTKTVGDTLNVMHSRKDT